MNQIQKRLKIINLAIFITDIDTIQLQILKLAQIKTDTVLQEIIDTLQARNYTKAQSLINEYLNNPPQKKVDNMQISSNISKEVDKDSETIETKLDDTLKTQYISNTQKDILPNNTNINVSSSNPFADWNETLDFATSDILKDTYFNEIQLRQLQISDTNDMLNDYTYAPIQYIEEKFQNILKQYPQTQPKATLFESTQKWLKKIKTEGYSEEDIEKIIGYIKEISPKNRSEASQLLLLTACSKSKYAILMLARELYKGELLEQDINQSFDLIYQLAIKENYPEAICDLAQFYEYGVGIKADKKQALKLYDEAMQQGIVRAMKHYDRLYKQKKKIFSLF